MAQCLGLASRARGFTAPNPMVGAIVLDKAGRRVAEGWHEGVGKPHAEVIALDKAGPMAKGGTLFCNLEPCNHHGRTPPCTERIIQAGIRHVVFGTADPNPNVEGRGHTRLLNAGITVSHGVLAEACEELNRNFFSMARHHRPFLAVKMAMTRDGRVADRDGRSRWISGELSRQYGHWLRAGMDAVMISGRTLMVDNPLLNVRGLPQPCPKPLRVVIDRRFEMDPARYKLFQSALDTDKGQVQVYVSRIHHHQLNAKAARQMGVAITEVDESAEGGLNFDQIYEHLAGRGVQGVLVEPGGRLAHMLLRQKLAQRWYLVYGQTVLDDVQAFPSFGGTTGLAISEASTLQTLNSWQIEQDVWVEAALA